MKPEGFRRITKSMLLAPLLSQINPIHNLVLCFKIMVIVDLSSCPRH
jgi:hypothetical protein